MNNSASGKFNRWLHGFALLTAVATFMLLGLGGLVTSHEAGMSVPDWPNTYGYNMFLFPVSKWVGGIFYEHTHRLLASTVGLLTTILAVWLWRKDSRPWMHWLGVTAFLLVVAQGILGGLRVVLTDAQLGIFHGVLAQFFFVVTGAIALFTSRWWHAFTAQKTSVVPRGLRNHVLFLTLCIFGQLIIGATMRHQHAGLSIWDFPLAHGRIWPDTSPAAIAEYNAHRPPEITQGPITAFQVNLQMVHRLVAYFLFLGIVATPFMARKRLGAADPLTKLTWLWLGLIVAQIGLGAATIWSNKAADVATAHVLGGALLLMTGALWCIVAFRRSEPATESHPLGAFGTQPALTPNK